MALVELGACAFRKAKRAAALAFRHDRGLGLAELSLKDLVQAADGQLMLGPVASHPLDPKQAATPRADQLRWGFELPAEAQRAAFEHAYLRAHRCGASERQRLRQELGLER